MEKKLLLQIIRQHKTFKRAPFPPPLTHPPHLPRLPHPHNVTKKKPCTTWEKKKEAGHHQGQNERPVSLLTYIWLCDKLGCGTKRYALIPLYQGPPPSTQTPPPLKSISLNQHQLRWWWCGVHPARTHAFLFKTLIKPLKLLGQMWLRTQWFFLTYSYDLKLLPHTWLPAHTHIDGRI